MQNEFEKQVQQKMEELKLIPSQPVWDNVEMQIRKKRERRRLAFLLPLFFVLIAGGVWIGTEKYSANISLQKTEDKKTVNQSTKNNSDKTEITNATRTKETATFDQIATNDQKKENNQLNQRIVFEKNSSNHNHEHKPKKDALLIVKENKPVYQEETAAINNENPGKTTTRLDEENNKNNDNLKVPAADTGTKPERSNFLNSNKKDRDTTEKRQVRTNAAQPDSSKADQSNVDSVMKPLLKKHVKPKWQYAVVANVGTSGLGRINFYNGEKSLNTQLSSPGATGGVVYSSSSSVENGLAFSVGLLKQKQLEKRVSLIIGLQYWYYSNSILVGTKVQRDTTFKNLYTVSQFFTSGVTPSTTGGPSYSIFLQPYTNRYHFISLPLAIDWQMFGSFPLNFHAGFSLQEMIQTNALIFDNGSQAYYHNNKAFNKTQLAAEYGMSYAIHLKKQVLSVGPELQYALSSIEKNNPQHHLYSYGLKAQLQLNKK